MSSFVVWDGTRRAACGTSYLAAEPEAPCARPAARRPRSSSPLHRVAAALVAGPLTCREVTSATGLTVAQANSVLWRLEQRGYLRVSVRPTAQFFGRRGEKMYTWIPVAERLGTEGS